MKGSFVKKRCVTNVTIPLSQAIAITAPSLYEGENSIDKGL